MLVARAEVRHAAAARGAQALAPAPGRDREVGPPLRRGGGGPAAGPRPAPQPRTRREGPLRPGPHVRRPGAARTRRASPCTKVVKTYSSDLHRPESQRIPGRAGQVAALPGFSTQRTQRSRRTQSAGARARVTPRGLCVLCVSAVPYRGQELREQRHELLRAFFLGDVAGGVDDRFAGAGDRGEEAVGVGERDPAVVVRPRRPAWGRGCGRSLPGGPARRASRSRPAMNREAPGRKSGAAYSSTRSGVTRASSWKTWRSPSATIRRRSGSASSTGASARASRRRAGATDGPRARG